MDPSLLHIEGEAPEVPGFLSHGPSVLQHDVVEELEHTVQCGVSCAIYYQSVQHGPSLFGHLDVPKSDCLGNNKYLYFTM